MTKINYVKKIAEKIIGRSINDIELDNIINNKNHKTYTKLIMVYYNISHKLKSDNNINNSSCLIKNCIGV